MFEVEVAVRLAIIHHIQNNKCQSSRSNAQTNNNQHKSHEVSFP